MLTLFIQGGPWFMGILTVLLAGIFFTAWKAPRWVKEIGLFALVFGFFSLCLGLRQAFVYIAGSETPVAQHVIFGGMSVAMIPVLYGIIIYLISLVVRLIQKPRI